MAQITKFASDIDGKVFDTQAEQLAYDAAKRHEAKINAFLDAHYPVVADAKKQGPARKIVAKGLALWLGQEDGAKAESAEVVEQAE